MINPDLRNLPDPPPFEKGPDLKECTKCSELMPENKQYFHEDITKPGGFHSRCRICRSGRDIEKKKKMISDRVKDLDAATLEIIVKMGKCGVEESSVPHMASVLESIVFAFGGLQEFSKQYVAQFLMSKPGGAMRSKMLSGMVALSVQVSKDGTANRQLNDMSQEELERAKDRMESNFVKKITLMHENVDDGVSTDEPPETSDTGHRGDTA